MPIHPPPRYREIVSYEVEELMTLFEYSQLPPHLQEASKPFFEHAHRLVTGVTWSFETVACLRALVIAKDAAVRALVIHRRYVGDG
jgi:hypothetical protein